MRFPSPILAAARLAFLSGALAAFFATTSIAAPGAGESRAPAAQPSTSGAHGMDLVELEKRVRATPAISVFQKLELQKEVNELLARFRQVHLARTSEISSLRQPYERLIASIQSRLGRDPQLAGEIFASREAIWGVLTDRTKFVTI